MRPGWTRLTDPKAGKAQAWLHESGHEVRHCGHPTAIRPWYAVTPAGDVMVTHNGGAFTWLDAARDAVEGVVAGELEVERRAFPGARLHRERVCVLGVSWDREGRGPVRRVVL